MKHTQAVIHLQDNARPRYIRARSVPLALREKVAVEIREMEKRGTISKIDSSEWASPIVSVLKPDGSVRVCADFTQTISPVVNKMLHPLPHPDELFADLAQARYNVLPYGLASAPAIVQAAQERLLSGIRGVKIYIDDVLIFSRSKEEHFRILNEVFSRISNAGGRLKPGKCILMGEELTYLGFRISQSGRSLDPELIRPVLDFPVPASCTEVKSFLGLVQYYGHFIPHLSEEASPLHELLKKDIVFSWSEKRQVSFQNIKSAIANSPVLTHYDPSLPLVLSTDASPIGLGAVLAQLENGMERPVAFASRKLSKSEANYSQIDKEATGIIYGLKKFERYLIGRHFKIKTDHKPLQYILNPCKDLPSVVSARLARFSMLLSTFDYSIEHVRGIDHSHADAFSRVPVDDPPCLDDPTELLQCRAISSSCSSESSLLSALQEDQELCSAVEAARTGVWDSTTLRAYSQRKNCLSLKNGLLFWGIRLIVPLPLRRKFMQELHLTHRGVVKMKSVARSVIWWPGFDNDVEDFVSACRTCQESAPAPASQFTPFSPANVWERVHVDYGKIKGKDFLILMDAGSKWIEAAYMTNTSSEATLRQLFAWFSRFGFPEKIHSDNGSQFASDLFKTKMSEWGVAHSFSPPYHPQSNGQAERGVRIIKNGIKKNIGASLEEILFAYRATPLECGSTPAELLGARRIRTRLDGYLPSPATLPHPSSPSPPSSRKKEFKIKMTVWCRWYGLRQPKWVAGVLQKKIGDVLWSVQTPQGMVKRHMNQLRPRVQVE
nr:uncharacterized protein K02A2.6-like [Lepeophtheirus salmonis]